MIHQTFTSMHRSGSKRIVFSSRTLYSHYYIPWLSVDITILSFRHPSSWNFWSHFIFLSKYFIVVKFDFSHTSKWKDYLGNKLSKYSLKVCREIKQSFILKKKWQKIMKLQKSISMVHSSVWSSLVKASDHSQRSVIHPTF